MFKPIARLYRQLNPATLSGAIDIVIVQQPDGSYNCSPFHVRFGKFQVPYASISLPDVEIVINGELCESLKMIVGESGEALFLDEGETATMTPERRHSSTEEEGDRDTSQFKVINMPPVIDSSDSGTTTDYSCSPEEEDDFKEKEAFQTVKRKRKRKRKSELDKHHANTTPRRTTADSGIDAFPLSTSSPQQHSEGKAHAPSDANFTESSKPTSNDNAMCDPITGEKISSVDPAMSSLGKDKPQVAIGSSGKSAFSVVDTSLNSQMKGGAEAGQPSCAVVPVSKPSSNLSQEQQPPSAQETQNSAFIDTLRVTNQGVRSSCSCSEDPSLCNVDGGKGPVYDDLQESIVNIDRPESPKSDSEIGVSTSNVIENVSWLWGEHLEPYKPENPPSPNSNLNRVGLPSEGKASQRYRSLSPQVSQTRKASKDSHLTSSTGLYLESLASKDPSTQQLYLGASKDKNTSRAQRGPLRSPNPPAFSTGSLNPQDRLPSCPSSPTANCVAIQASPGHWDASVEPLTVGCLDESVTSEIGSSMPQSPGAMFEDVAVQTYIGSEGEILHSNIQMSLCGGLKGTDSVISAETFGQYLLTYDDFQNDPFNVLTNPNLVIKMNGTYFKWQVAAPLILSHVVFQRPLDDPTRTKLLKDFMPPSSSSRGWGWWGRSRTATEVNNGGASKSLKSNSSAPQIDLQASGKGDKTSPITVEVTNAHGTESYNVHEGLAPLDGTNKPPTLVSSKSSTDIASAAVKAGPKTTNRLTSSQIARLNLHKGSNEITFRVTSQFMGSTTLQANIFVFDSDEKIVISDVDGTVTRSDVMGQLLPLSGVTDWSQQGIVTLYRTIADNGYKFIYLSARAISMASMTKTYLRKVCQNEQLLPDGPLLLSPASLASAFHQEVILKKPEEFKIRCLTDIRSLFPETENPLYAGFGNKNTDTISYSKVGIPNSRIFIINHRGDVKIENSLSIQTSYHDLCGKVDHIFPALDSRTKLENLDFTAFHYWRYVPPAEMCLALEVSSEVIPSVSSSLSTSDKSSSSNSKKSKTNLNSNKP